MNKINPKDIYEISRDSYSYFWDADTISDNKSLQVLGFIIAFLGIISVMFITLSENTGRGDFIFLYVSFSVISAGIFLYSIFGIGSESVDIPNMRPEKINKVKNTNNELISWAEDYAECTNSLIKINQKKANCTQIGGLFFIISIIMLIVGIWGNYFYG